MLEKKISSLIYFGTTLRYLQDVKEGYHVKSKGTVLDNIKAFLRNLDEFGLTVTRRAAYKLVDISKELEQLTEPALSADHAIRLCDIMDKMRPTLFAESGGMISYVVSERRFPIERLMDDPGHLFATGVFEKLPDIAQQDFSEAAKCLAFERSTAAAFHMLRGTESVLRYYYCEKVKRKRVDLMWGPMIQTMKSMPRRFPGPLLNHLDHIRVSFRNPTAHPEKSYDIDESQDLFSICIEVANRMIQDLK
jgi:hypothetical protein